MKELNTVILRRLTFIDRKFQPKDKRVKTSDLAEEYEVNKKTILKDIDFLKTQYDAPIEYDPREKAYFYSKAFKLRTFDFSITELYNLAIIREMIRSIKSNPYKTGQKSIFNKLFQSFGDEILNEVKKVREKVSFNFKPLRKLNEKVFKVIEDALFEERRILIEYFMVDKNESDERKIDPYHLRNYEGDWYLIGYNHEKGKIRIMAMNRITKAKMTDQHFEIPEDFNIEKYFENSFRKRRTSSSYDIKIEVKRQFISQILETEIHSSQKTRELPNGNILISFKANDLLEIKEWVLTKRSMVIVKSPAELISMVTEDAAAILKTYSKLHKKK